jgi:hypothetical protein
MAPWLWLADREGSQPPAADTNQEQRPGDPNGVMRYDVHHNVYRGMYA